jgi:NAD(P)-dependent dehydrogenase (short-subunit alcohol dehydrogenase family)
VSRESDVAAAFGRTAEILGGLDVLASCAGLEQPIPPEVLTEADMDRMLGVHVKGTMFTNQQAFEPMRERGMLMMT